MIRMKVAACEGGMSPMGDKKHEALPRACG